MRQRCSLAHVLHLVSASRRISSTLVFTPHCVALQAIPLARISALLIIPMKFIHTISTHFYEMLIPPAMFSSITTACAVVNTSVKLAQVGFELHAVGERTAQLLKLSERVDGTLQHARTMRRQAASLLSSSDKVWMDGILDGAKEAIGRVVRLIEPARVDREITGRVSLVTQAVFMLRDSPEVAEILAMMNIQNTNLNTMVSVLYTIQSTAASSRNAEAPCSPVISFPSSIKYGHPKSPPPTYEQSERQDRLSPQAHIQTLGPDHDQETIVVGPPSTALAAPLSTGFSDFTWTSDMSGLQVCDRPLIESTRTQVQTGLNADFIDQVGGLHVCDDWAVSPGTRLSNPTNTIRHSTSFIESRDTLHRSLKGSGSLRRRPWLAQQVGDIGHVP